MSNAIEVLEGRSARAATALGGLHQAIWINGVVAAAAWAAAALATIGLPDVVPWGSANLFAWIMGWAR
jgi:NitT/TauT family transport system permease protein